MEIIPRSTLGPRSPRVTLLQSTPDPTQHLLPTQAKLGQRPLTYVDYTELLIITLPLVSTPEILHRQLPDLTIRAHLAGAFPLSLPTLPPTPILKMVYVVTIVVTVV